MERITTVNGEGLESFEKGAVVHGEVPERNVSCAPSQLSDFMTEESLLVRAEWRESGWMKFTRSRRMQ